MLRKDEVTVAIGANKERDLGYDHSFDNNLVARHPEISQVFLNSLDNDIGRVTTKRKEQGVHTAVTNIAAGLITAKIITFFANFSCYVLCSVRT